MQGAVGLTGFVEGEVRGAAQFKGSLPPSYTRKALNDEFGLTMPVETILGAIPVGVIPARARAMEESWGGRLRFVYVPQLDPFAGLLPSAASPPTSRNLDCVHSGAAAENR
jgi:hypothetical protein